MPTTRRQIIASGLASAALVLPALPRRTQAATGNFEVTRTEAEWRAMLTDLQYAVMREEDTERAFTSPLHDLKTPGMYHCRGCDLPLYSSKHKFDSGTGWPSFWKAQSNAIRTKPDRSFFVTRTECHCRRCGSHLGHIFDDGPEPTGKRHCINGVSLVFRAA
ncbi:peptide-methionine (R)-S-oxide reductase MsrB [Primorskyibacter aestuariivivens]|uniref:peptide-methionine (R)-S-oxide reductase MsrB n=1 Tax=Primorskyibacter aestuariivivens TaxID=1888912 RepID=UPI002300CBF8|nr:peptide-methionine (R)-S-oxide reductase MsrB [Primorskyibacter aestuariivivens]MDA7428666.1 peptide-methionine (R)-S-oxide reductase MsrB [Primorskyibacter aestuariivivens]